MMKPDWKDAPAWAEYLAQDQDGTWWWFEFKPSALGDLWGPGNGGEFEEAELSYDADSWKRTLEGRPK